MDDELILLFLRLVAGASLLCFIGSVAYLLYRDLNQTAQTVRARSEAYGRLVVLNGGSESLAADTVLPLLRSTTIGRSPTNTIRIEDNYTSNEHARIVWRLGQWWLEDHHSSNGTKLNNIPVEESIVLSSGDIIGIGNVQLRLELD